MKSEDLAHLDVGLRLRNKWSLGYHYADFGVGISWESLHTSWYDLYFNPVVLEILARELENV